MRSEQLNEILARIKDVSVCVIGDICLDAYWRADMRKSILSRETPHHPLPVVKETYSLGGGGNVLANLAALGVGRVRPIALLGDDWRGFLIRRLLSEIGIADDMVFTDPARVSPCYVKPMRKGIADVEYEDPRLDFENYTLPDGETERLLLDALDSAARDADILAVCDQTAFGAVTPRIRARLAELAGTVPVVADSKYNIARFEGVMIKPNELEVREAVGDLSETPRAAARRLSLRSGRPVLLTLGENGSVWCDGDQAVPVAPFPVEPPVDIVGAGDTFLSAFCAAYAAGVSGPDAMAFASLASSVTVKKIGTTGTASPDELRAALLARAAAAEA